VLATLKIKGGSFKHPVWVDVITGNVYEIPTEKLSVTAQIITFKDIPVYDAPAFITDKNAFTYKESPALLYEHSKQK
jgi:hypothetical protein